MRVPMSVILEGLLRDAPTDATLEWIVANLRERSFGIVMLLIALVGLAPGLSPLSSSCSSSFHCRWKTALSELSPWPPRGSRMLLRLLQSGGPSRSVRSSTCAPVGLQ